MSRLYCVFILLFLINMAHAIQVSEQGQLLFAPLYMTDSSHESTIVIENLHTDSAVKAIISFRSQQSGVEMLNFGLYLAPQDRFEATLKQIDGQVYLLSSDDSMQSLNLDGSLMSNGSGQTFSIPRQVTANLFGLRQNLFADQRASRQPLFTHNLDSDESNQSGYITVLGVYAVQGEVQTATGLVKIEQGMQPVLLSNIFETARISLETDNGLEIPAHQTQAASGNIRSTDPSWFNLQGHIKLKQANQSLELPMIALLGTVSHDQYGEDNRLISNPVYDHAIGGVAGIAYNQNSDNIEYAELYRNSSSELGLGFSFGGVYQNFLIPAYDNILKIEAALAQSKIRLFPTAAAQQLLVTFPLKYRQQSDVCNASEKLYDNQYAPPFDYMGNVPYQIQHFSANGNLKSNITSGLFHNYINSLPIYLSNWINGDYLELNFNIDNPCPAFDGVPALVSLQNILSPSFWQPSQINSHVHAHIRIAYLDDPIIFDIFSSKANTDLQVYNLYAGLVLPDGRLLGIRTDKSLRPILSPFYQGRLNGERVFSILNTPLSLAIPEGNYQACTLIVLAGYSPYQSQNWQGFHCEDLLIQHRQRPTH